MSDREKWEGKYRFRLVVRLIIGLALILAACATDPDERYDWTGMWRGTATLTGSMSVQEPPTTEQGVIELDLTQSGSRVSGVWTGEFPSGALGGPVSGAVTETTIQMTFSVLSPIQCAFAAEGTRSNQTLTGILEPQVCLIELAGTFSLIKQ
jgi:hypothetical protein